MADPTLDSPCVAFALPRSLGSAVRRNRLRRRLREHLRALDARAELPRGLYLVGCRPGAADLSGDELRGLVSRVVSRVVSRLGA